jgi:serine/threonine protein kinase/tetratricopeptide (TPR) repeat protein
MTNLVGLTVLHYKIVEKLGEGGMGVVYRADDTKLRRTVALKFLPHAIVPHESDRVRFLREARAAAALNHPGICSVIDILDHDGEQFIVMEYLEGESLRARIVRGEIPAREAVQYAMQIADAVAEAHRKGVIHRDIKPENVVVSPAGRVKVMDFGLARSTASTRITRDGAVAGTVAYMSPEQARGETVDVRTDIWSFGVLLYEACTGVLPFASAYDQAMVYGILHETPRSPRILNPALPEPLERIILRCLAKSPRERYATMEECLADLRAIDGVRDSTGSPPAMSGAPRRRLTRFAPIVLGIAVLLVASILFWPHARQGDGRSSIAVLPFKNLNDHAEDAFFAEGLTEDIISELGTVRGLKVIGRSSVMRYDRSEKPIQDIASELGAATLLEGSVRHYGDNLRVVARLVDRATGEDLWRESYDRNLRDILTIQGDISRRIAAALRFQILADSASSKGKPLNLEAWRLYQKGRSEWYKRSAGGIRAAIDDFEKSVAADPEFAPAHAGLADALALLGDNGVLEVRPAEAFRKAKVEALKAIALDDNLAEAHASLGHLQMHQFEWAQAERSLRRAVDLNPSSPIAQVHLGLYCSAVGKMDEARERFQNALLVDPLSIFTTSTAAAVYLRMGRSDSAVAILDRMLRIEPSSPRLHFVRGWAYSTMGRPDDAVREFQIARLTQNDAEVRVALARAYALAGRRGDALALVDSLTGGGMKEFVDPTRVAGVYVALGQKEDALRWLERAFRGESAAIIFLKTDPWFNDLHAEPRFQSIVKGLGLAPS